MKPLITQITAAVMLGWGSLLSAQTPAPTELEAIHFSGDIDHQLPAPDSSNLASMDDTLAVFNLDTATAIGFNDLDVLDNSALDAFHAGDINCGVALYSIEATADIFGTVMRPADVFDVTGTKFLDAMAASIPDGVNVDAVSWNPADCDVIISVDVHAELDGTVYAPDDLIAWNATDGFSLFMATGLGANIDALHLFDDPDRILISTAEDVQIAGIAFQDHDVIELVAEVAGTLSVLSFSPALFNPTWDAADLDALWVMPLGPPGVFQWAVSEVEVFEDSGSVDVMITRTDGDQGSIDVSWTTIAGSADADVDFTSASDVLTLPDGVTSGMVTVSLLDDDLVEGNEDFMLRITAVSDAGVIGSPQDVLVVIRDDEDFIFADGFED